VSHLAAQRAIVRMLFDDQFAAAARRDPALLSSLPESLRSQLLAVDPRAFHLDGHRHKRALEVLREEFPHSTRELPELARFFSSQEFHRCVDENGSMIFAFAQFLDGKCDAGVLTLETAVARARRSARVPVMPRPGEVACAPGVLAVEAPLAALAALGGVTSLDRSVVPIATVPLDDGITLVQIDAPTFALLQALAQPRSPAGLDDALISSLVDDEILVRG
jgi:hypothetical protein